MQGKLIYTFVSSAARVQNGVTCMQGMQRLADLLHPLRIPITWLVSAESARLAADSLTAWHLEHGDAVAVHSPKLEGEYDTKRSQLERERAGIHRALPWADLRVAAHNHQDPDMPRLLEDLGFEALWGFCWEQVEVDKFWDRGSPWGFYYVDPQERLRPATGRGIVGIEWTSRDLLKSFHSGAPQLYSTDPNDVARGGLCSWDACDYWKGLADSYVRNARHNDAVYLVHHQEAHEMERSSVSAGYTEEDIRESAQLITAFAQHLGTRMHATTLPEAVRQYREQHAETAPSYMLWDDLPAPRPNPDYAWDIPVGPWPRTFLYYDRDCQMMFIDGKTTPHCVRNYDRPMRRGEYFAEPVLPPVRLVSNTARFWSREIELLVNSPAAMPYGAVLWGDYSLYRVAETPGLKDAKILSPNLLFVRFDLQEGENRVAVTLQGK
jgi:hypothetical protein